MVGRLTENSEIFFTCKCCGTCCSSDLEIFINSQDVWNLRNHFRTPTSVLFEKYLVLERRPEFGSFPLCLIRVHNGYCPFLLYRLCSVHPARPAACRMFPVVHSYGGSCESVFSMAPFGDFCQGGRDGRRWTLEGWLAGIDFSACEKVVSLQHRLAGLFKLRIGDAALRELERMLFDFDSLENFPFLGDFSQDRASTDAAINWISEKAERFLETLGT